MTVAFVDFFQINFRVSLSLFSLKKNDQQLASGLTDCIHCVDSCQAYALIVVPNKKCIYNYLT